MNYLETMNQTLYNNVMPVQCQHEEYGQNIEKNKQIDAKKE